MKLSAYLRFSPGGDDTSLDIQRDVITSWAKNGEGHEIITWHDDAGISGGESLDVRLGLYDAIQEVKTGATAGIVVRELGRFSRDVVNQEMYIRDIERSGGKVFSTNSMEQQFLNDEGSADHTRKLLRTIIGAIGEWEKSNVTLRMAAGRRVAHSQGKRAYGPAYFGTTMSPHDSGKGAVLVVNDDQVKVILRMRELRESGLTIQQVTDALNSEGFTSPRGGRWGVSSVHRVLARSQEVPAG